MRMDMSLCTLSESTVNVNDSRKNVLLKPQRPQRGFCKLCASWYLHRYINHPLCYVVHNRGVRTALEETGGANNPYYVLENATDSAMGKSPF